MWLAFYRVQVQVVAVPMKLRMENITQVTEFILVGFFAAGWLHHVLLIVLLSAYVIAMVGNLLIIFVVSSDYRLQLPMYYFLGHLSFQDICFSSCSIPKLLFILATGNKTISFIGCIMQSYFYFLLGAVHFLLLTTMSLDRYVAICYPLRYPKIMTRNMCFMLVLGSWVGGFLDTILQTILVSRKRYCGTIIDHFFCDVAPLLKLACTQTHLIELVNHVMSGFLIFGSLMPITVSYIYIVRTVLKIPSAEGRSNAFSTCSSHITLVVILYSCSVILSIRPKNGSVQTLNKMATIIVTVTNPMLNPFIYTMRNKLVTGSLRDALKRAVLIRKA